MKINFLAILLALTFAASGISAHGDKKHVLGIIEKVSPGAITVKTRDGKSVEVKLVPSTTYVSRVGNSDKPAVAADLAVGQTAVVHATPKGDQLEADEVKFSAAGFAAPAAPKSHP